MKRRMLAVAAMAVLAVAGSSAIADGATSPAKVTQGVVFGAVTKQGYPVTIELSATGRKVVRATIGMELTCGMPPNIDIPDDVKNIPVSASGLFKASQPETTIPADPTTGAPKLVVSASLTGRVNKARTQIKGTWQRKIVIYNPADPTGVAVFDTCDTGPLAFKAKN